MLYAYLWLKAWMSEEEGQDLIEYVLIAGLVALVAVGAITVAGTNVNLIWEAIRDEIIAAVP